MIRLAQFYIATTCCLFAVASFTAPALRGMIARPPPPLDPESTVPAPSATPSDPEKDDIEPREPSHTEAADDSQDSGKCRRAVAASFTLAVADSIIVTSPGAEKRQIIRVS